MHPDATGLPNRPAPPVAVVEEDAVLLSRMVGALVGMDGLRPFCRLDEVLEAGLAPPDGTDPRDGLILVLGPSQADEEILDRVSAMVHTGEGVGALVVVSQPDATTLRLALRAGLDDAVVLDQVDEDLAPAVRDLGYRLAAAMAGTRSSVPPVAPAGPRRGRLTTVFSPKGGVGKSVVSVNLATSLAQRSAQPVILVDFDLQFGDVSVMLRLKPAHHLAEATTAGDRLDRVLLESLLVRDERSQVSVLAAPSDPSETAKITPQAVSQLIAVLRDMAAHIVVDTPNMLDDVVLQLLAESDDIVYVVGMDVPSVKNARLGLQALELVQIPLERVLLVLNRADSRVHLATRDVERVLQMKVDASLPSDALVPQSVNKGTPAVLEFDRSRFAARVHQITDLLLARTPREVDK